VTAPRTVLTVAATALTLLVTLAPGPAVAGSGHPDRFHSGQVYRGSFPDPDVIRHRGLWIAVSTTIARRSLPMLTSKNGRTWRARVAHGLGRHRTNDAFVGIPRWAKRKPAGSRRFVPVWAPAMGRAGNGRWLVAYSAPRRTHPHKRCIGLAQSTHPQGPFHHVRKRPLVCAHRQNAIDPDLFRWHGRTYLLWKTEGIRGGVPATLWSRPLRRDGHRFKPGSKPHRLLRPGPAWEGPVIENPSMIRFHGRFYLFYSGNRWYTRRYAVGYAVCRSPLGRCHRVQHRPLLTSGRRVVGPGGQSAFRGPGGRLLLAYAAWPAHRVGTERRLHVARLKVKKHGRLVVERRMLPRR
jgi:hypothetical protein